MPQSLYDSYSQFSALNSCSGQDPSCNRCSWSLWLGLGQGFAVSETWTHAPPLWPVIGALPGTDTEERRTRGSSQTAGGAGRAHPLKGLLVNSG